MELNNHQFPKPLVLLAALKQFEYQAANRLLLTAPEELVSQATPFARVWLARLPEEYGDSGITQKRMLRR